MYLYDNLCSLHNQDAVPEAERWTRHCEEPDKRVYYKQENGYAFGSVLTDCIIESNMQQAIACYDNIEILSKLMPEFYDLAWHKKVTDVKGFMYGKQVFPWPLAHRDLVFHVTGVADYKNKAFISVSKSKEAGETYHDVLIPDCPPDLARIEVKMGFNFF